MPRYGSKLVHSGQVVGRVTAYEISPYLECGVGFAIFDSAEVLQQSGLAALDRDGHECPVELIQLPFYDAEKRIPRGLADADGGVAGL